MGRGRALLRVTQVAMPTIFGEGALVGRKSTKMYALDALTGQPHFYTDDSSTSEIRLHCSPTNPRR